MSDEEIRSNSSSDDPPGTLNLDLSAVTNDYALHVMSADKSLDLRFRQDKTIFSLSPYLVCGSESLDEKDFNVVFMIDEGLSIDMEREGCCGFIKYSEPIHTSDGVVDRDHSFLVMLGIDERQLDLILNELNRSNRRVAISIVAEGPKGRPDPLPRSLGLVPWDVQKGETLIVTHFSINFLHSDDN